MKATLIDGKALAADIVEQLKASAEELKAVNVCPCIALILVGQDSASKNYVRLKATKANEIGIAGKVYELTEQCSTEQLLKLIDELNKDTSIHGILVQLPLPEHIDTASVLADIDPRKDVDGLHPQNAGALMENGNGLVPCTPMGIIRLIESTGTVIAGKTAVVVGRSNLVGKPTAMLLLNHDATVTVCHSGTIELGKFTKTADILVCAVGRAELISGEMVKPGAVVIDVGQSMKNGRLTGDVEFESVSNKAAYITPVKGGVGPMTVIMLMENVIKAAKYYADGN